MRTPHYYKSFSSSCRFFYFKILLAKKDIMVIAPGYEFKSYENKKISESLLGINENSFYAPKKWRNALIDSLQFGTSLILNDN